MGKVLNNFVIYLIILSLFFYSKGYCLSQGGENAFNNGKMELEGPESASFYLEKAKICLNTALKNDAINIKLLPQFFDMEEILSPFSLTLI